MFFPVLWSKISLCHNVGSKIIFSFHAIFMKQVVCFKGTRSRLVMFVYNFFLPQTLYIGTINPSLNRTAIFKLVVNGKSYARPLKKDKINKRTLDFNLKTESLSLFSHKIALGDVYKHKWLVPMFTNKDFYE